MLNNTISIGAEYLQKKVKQQYSQHMVALVREFLQNSVDANSTEINFKFNYDERILTVVDNGDGMDDFIMVNYLFQLGGTKKNTGKPTGGFGAAKLILLFQHEYFKITSWKNGKKYEVNGCADRYSDFNITEEGGKGTIIEIKFLPDWAVRTFYDGSTTDEYCTFEYLAKSFLKECDFSANVYWNDEKIIPTAPGKLFKKLEWANVYFKDVGENICCNYVKVRINGLLMFKNYVEKMSKDVTVEISYDSLSVLTENRDGLKGTFSTELQSLIGEFNKDTESFSRLSGKTFIYRGEEQSFRYLCMKTVKEFSSNIIKKLSDKIKRCKEMSWEEELNRLEKMKNEFLSDFDTIVQNHSDNIEETIEKMSEDIMFIENSMCRKEKISQINSEGLKRLVEAMSISAKTMGIETDETEKEMLIDIDKNSQISATKHDFVVKVDKKMDKLPKNIDPSTLSQKYLRLMQLYTHSIKTIANLTNNDISFKIGWILSDNALAMFVRENNEFTFLINPESKKWFDADSKANCVKRIARTAAHEFVHYIGITYHDETFNAQYDMILEKLDTISSWTKFESDAYAINI